MLSRFQEALSFLRIDTLHPTLKEIEFILHGVGQHKTRARFFSNDLKEYGREMEGVLFGSSLFGSVTTRFHLTGVKSNIIQRWALPALRTSFPSLDKNNRPRIALSWDGKFGDLSKPLGVLRMLMMTLDQQPMMLQVQLGTSVMST